MDKWKENIGKNTRKKGFFIFLVITLIVLALLVLIIGFFIFLWPGILFTILGGRKV